LRLPEFLWRDTPADEAQVTLGMTLTGHFLAHHVFAPQGRTLPPARLRLADLMRQAAGNDSVSR
jgi:DNA repair protein RecO (recombination protein O)